MRLTTKPVTADAEAWNPADPGPFAQVAGSQFLGNDGNLAVVRMQNGCVMHVHEGWLVVRIDGAGDGQAFFITPEHLGVTWDREAG